MQGAHGPGPGCWAAELGSTQAVTLESESVCTHVPHPHPPTPTAAPQRSHTKGLWSPASVSPSACELPAVTQSRLGVLAPPTGIFSSPATPLLPFPCSRVLLEAWPHSAALCLALCLCLPLHLFVSLCVSGRLHLSAFHLIFLHRPRFCPSVPLCPSLFLHARHCVHLSVCLSSTVSVCPESSSHSASVSGLHARFCVSLSTPAPACIAPRREQAARALHSIRGGLLKLPVEMQCPPSSRVPFNMHQVQGFGGGQGGPVRPRGHRLESPDLRFC